MPNEHAMKMLSAHKLIAEFTYEPVELVKGYADRILRIDLDKNEIKTLPVTQQMKDLWIGGKGFDLWLTFQEINKNTKWDSNNNPICFSPGPLCGTATFPGAGKTLVTAISPLTGTIIDSNVGGYFGPYFKFAGFDSLVVVGKAKEDVIIFIDKTHNRITIETAPLESVDAHLISEEIPEMYADNELDKRNIAVVSAGRGAEHTKMGLLNFSFWDWRRDLPRLKQAGRGGIGTVFRDKKIKAIVARNAQVDPSWTIEESKTANYTRPLEVSKDCCSHSQVDEITKIANKWENNPEYVIEMMQDIQQRFRHIPESAIDTLNKITKTPKAHLYQIATFYKSFSLDQKGEKTIQVCMGTACHVKGAEKLLDNFERILKVKSGGTTVDKKYTLEAVACLGACSIAPVVKIGEEVFGNVQVKDCEKLLAKSEAKVEGK
ncbi:NAD(P)H-dependent oxidoreductase subunit E [Candidatus Dojkabacteria bacterium]|nr:NAD(P)H-dependent oxidoreductase subunit E [Candidatus Dojkabacteria bacterium]MBN2793755.1 NAD(P)H-dependent oxidoreductase subunit E [Clostridia bacterium]